MSSPSSSNTRDSRSPTSWWKSSSEHGDVIDWRDELDPEQAKIVAEIVDRLLAGEPIKAVTGDLNDRGVPGPRGGGWIPSGVRKVALRPANAALRVHHTR